MSDPQLSDLITAVFDCMKETKPYGSLSQYHGVNFSLRRSRSAICCLLSVHVTGRRVLLVECAAHLCLTWRLAVRILMSVTAVRVPVIVVRLRVCELMVLISNVSLIACSRALEPYRR